MTRRDLYLPAYLITTLVFACTPFLKFRYEVARNELRIISVCVLFQEDALIYVNEFVTTLQEVSASYEDHIGIRFVPHVLPYPGQLSVELGKLMIPQRKVRKHIQAHCSSDTEIKIVVSNKGSGAYAFESWGGIVVYDISWQLNSRVYLGEGLTGIRLHRTLLHEIAHLFGVEENKDPASFMFAASIKNSDVIVQNQWTPQVEAKILKNKYRKWKL